MGVAEARLYRDLAHELPVRVPKAWYAEFEGTGTGADDRYVMVLEDLEASGCRFPTREDADIERRIFDIVEQLARLHAQYWQSPRFGRAAISPGSRRVRPGAATAARRWCAWRSTTSPTASPAGFVELSRRRTSRAPPT